MSKSQMLPKIQVDHWNTYLAAPTLKQFALFLLFVEQIQAFSLSDIDA